MEALDDASIERYSRQILLPEVGAPGQTRLAQARVALVGCGGLGVPAGLYLGAAGVGRLTLIDPDAVSLDNLNRQVAYRTDDLAAPKAALLAKRILEINPTIEVVALQEAVSPASVRTLLGGAEVVLECSDDPETKFLVNDFCTGEGIGLVVGGAVGLAGQSVTVPPGGACYRCLFGGPPNIPAQSCRDAGVLGALVGIIGSLQALEAIKLICDIGQEPFGRLLDFDAVSARWREVRFPPDPSCPAHAGVLAGNGHN